MSKFGNLVKRLYYDKKVRYLFVGVLNTIVGYGVTILMEVLLGIDIMNTEKADPVRLFIAQIVGQAIGTIHSFFWNKFFTFRSRERSFGEVVRFVLVYAVQFGVNYGLTMLLNHVFGWPVLVATPVTIVVCTLVSYFGHNFFSFRKQGADAESQKIAEEIAASEQRESARQEGNGQEKEEEEGKNGK